MVLFFFTCHCCNKHLRVPSSTASVELGEETFFIPVDVHLIEGLIPRERKRDHEKVYLEGLEHKKHRTILT